MGSQQILLIVLGVIIVGVSIAVGFTMFQNQAYAANRQALANEVAQYGALVIAFWKTPVNQGGAGNDPQNLTMSTLGQFIGFSQDTSKVVAVQNWGTSSENGQILLSAINTNTYKVTLKALGSEVKGSKHPYIELVVDVLTGTVSSTLSDAENM